MWVPPMMATVAVVQIVALLSGMIAGLRWLP